jgi:hypothetical protein
MRTTNLECASPSWLHIAMVTGTPQLHCSYEASISPYRSNSVPYSFDINDRLGATSFKSRYENWADEPMGQEFLKWAAECFGRSFLLSLQQECADTVFIGKVSNDSDEEGSKKNKRVMPEIKLGTDTQGYPMLPSWESIKDAELKYKKYLIGRYLSEMYRA